MYGVTSPWAKIAFCRNYMRGPKNPSPKGAEGKVCVITGGTNGIGREIAREMAIRGAVFSFMYVRCQ